MSDESLGLMGTCRHCGGKMRRTGRTRVSDPQPGFGQGKKHSIRSEEFVCTGCGESEWCEVGTEE